MPPNGQPIILLNDSQTTGGYLKLGSIPNFEIPKLSQTNINSKIRFKGISLSDSNNLRKKIDSKFNSIKLEDYFLYNHRIKNNHISVQISENDSIISIANEQLINVLKEWFVNNVLIDGLYLSGVGVLVVFLVLVVLLLAIKVITLFENSEIVDNYATNSKNRNLT